MLVVHHLEASRSQRILWLLEELELPYEIQRYQRDPKTLLAPPALKEIHPLGKSPIVVDDGRALVESAAVLEHIAEHHGQSRFFPAPGTDDHVRYRQFLHYAEASVMPPLLVSLIFNRVENGPVPFFVKPVVRRISGEVYKLYTGPQLDTHLGYLNDELGQRPWLAGDQLTLADFQMSYVVEAASTRGAQFSDRYPNLNAYLEKIRARPAYVRALEKGGPVTFGA